MGIYHLFQTKTSCFGPKIVITVMRHGILICMSVIVSMPTICIENKEKTLK